MIVDAGVDGGQSQVRLAIAGRPEVHAVEGVGHSDGDTVALLVDRIAEAWAAARQGGEELRRLVLGLTTMPADAVTADHLADRIAAATGAREVWLTGDAVTAHAGALPAGDGVVMVVGTGIACLAIDATSGATRRVDGDGFLLGDAGASFWIGSRGIEAALRAFDGRGGATSLSRAVEERFGSLDLLPGRLHAQERAVNAIAQFAAVVQDQARAGDAVAGAILADAADQVVASIRAAAGVVEHSPVPVAIAGRAVAEGTPLRELIDERLVREPRLVQVAAAGSPLDGACAIARDGDRPGYETLIRTRRSA